MNHQNTQGIATHLFQTSTYKLEYKIEYNFINYNISMNLFRKQFEKW